MDLGIKGKVAIVTGGNHGLGESICLALAAEGANVAINYFIDPDKAQELAAKIKADYGVEAMAVCADMAKEEQIVKMFEDVEHKFSHIDVLVNNAAYCPTCQVADMTEEMWNYTLQVNLTGTFIACRELVRRLLEKKQPGRIVNVSSQAAFRGSTTGHAPYDSSKGALVSFTVSLSREVCDKNIAINCIAPGIMRTEMMKDNLAKNEQKYIDRIPIKRVADPKEMADVVTFLASERASYMTGATVDVSGGLLMR